MSQPMATPTPMHPPMTSINDLGVGILSRVLRLLSPRDLARACTVQRMWHSVAGDEELWQPHIWADFDAKPFTGPSDSLFGSSRAAYGAWALEYADISGPYLARALRAWGRIKAWLKDNSPEILETLNPGATAAEIREAESLLQHELPLAVRAVYRCEGVHNGQDLRLGAGSATPPPRLLLGLFGTLMFYNDVTSNAMQPLAAVAHTTELLRQGGWLSNYGVAFAWTFNMADKLCFLDATSGDVFVMREKDPWMLAPPGKPGQQDGLLRWLEEWSVRLQAGWYRSLEGEACAASLAEAGISTRGAISLFPRSFPAAATAITRGVQVTWSAVFVPQESRRDRMLFTYCVRFALLTQQQEVELAEQLALQCVAADSEHAGTSGSVSNTPAGGNGHWTQAVRVGPCAATAGRACVSPSLTTVCPRHPHPDGAAAHTTRPPSANRTAPATPATLHPLASCQLVSRAWSIMGPNGDATDSVSGEGVVGLYPLLVPAGESFAYASCTPVSSLAPAGRGADSGSDGAQDGSGGALAGAVLGAMEGEFVFVPGSMMQRAGPEFSVVCPRVVFAVPDYIF